jgi:hypothetical protein
VLDEMPLEAPVPIGLTMTVLVVTTEVEAPVPVGPMGRSLVVSLP